MTLNVSKVFHTAKNISANAFSSFSAKKVGNCVFESFVTLNHYANNKSNKIIDSFHSDKANLDKVNDVINYVLDKKGFKDKVKIIDYRKAKFYGQELGPIDTDVLECCAQGSRCFYTPNDIIIGNILFFSKNSIIGNRQKAPVMILHELGHASNGKNIFLRMISSKSKYLYAISSSTSYLSALTKTNSSDKLNKFQKTENALHKTSPVIAAASYAPILFEEALASHKAIKRAEQLYGKEFSNKLKKPFKHMWYTYFTDCITNIMTAYATGKSKDFILNITNKIMP